jgi:hypothetical protein
MTSQNYRFKCITGCCEVINKGYLTYGELGRDPSDVAESTLWNSMGVNGVTKCTKCNEECSTVHNLGMHIKRNCSLRNIKCIICGEFYNIKDEKKHKQQCVFYCIWCGPTKNIIIYKDHNNNNKIKHFCINKKIT